jgi:hypothetical protein
VEIHDVLADEVVLLDRTRDESPVQSTKEEVADDEASLDTS